MSASLRPIGRDTGSIAVFVSGVSLLGVTTALDNALLATASGTTQLVRNIIASVVKVGLVPVFLVLGMRGGMSIYATWVIGMAVSVLVCSRHLAGTASNSPRYDGFRSLVKLKREALGHYALDLTLVVPALILPVLAALVTSPVDTARFTTARLVANFYFMIPFALPLALLANSRGSDLAIRSRIRMTLPLALALSIALYAAVFPAVGLILSLFGSSYAQGSAVAAFRIMTAASIALVAKDHYIAVRRVEGMMAVAALTVALGTILEITLALSGGYRWGLTGLCWGWTLAVICEGLFVCPALYRIWQTANVAPNHQAHSWITRRTDGQEAQNTTRLPDVSTTACPTIGGRHRSTRLAAASVSRRRRKGASRRGD
jgi:hypothetical protein